MLDDDIVTVPAGWYPDPMGLPQLRWWDNYAWTEFTSAARSPLIMQDEPKLAYADDDLPSRRSQRERRDRDGRGKRPADLASTLRQLEPPKPQSVESDHPAPAEAAPADQSSGPWDMSGSGPAFSEANDQGSGDAGYDPFAEFLAEPGIPGQTGAGYADPGQFLGGQTGFAPQQHSADPTAPSGFGQPHAASQFAQPSTPSGHDGRTQYGYGHGGLGVHAPLAYTPFVWIIAMIPLIQLVGVLLVVSAVDVAMAFPFLLAIAAGPYIAVIPLAVADRHQLLHTGHQHPAHWAWAILTAPAYLVARAIAASREHGKGLTPLLVWAALSLIQVASIIAVPGILISAMPAVFSAEVEESIEADSAIAGRQLAVDCPDTPPVQIGGTFNCTGVLATTGQEVGIVVRLQRANGWIDWRVYGMVWDTPATGENAEEPADEPETPLDDETPVDIVEGEVVTS